MLIGAIPMMMQGGGAEETPTLVGSTTASADTEGWTKNPLGISIESGDLLIVAFSCANGDSWSEDGDADFTELVDEGSATSGFGAFVGYQVLDGTETEFGVFGSSMHTVSAVLAVYRGAGTPSLKASDNGSGSANPPEASGLTEGRILLVTGHSLRDNPISAPSGFTLINQANEEVSFFSTQSSVAIADKDIDATTIDPGAFTQAGSSAWKASSIEIPGS